jgi:hypothetical protein
MVDTLATIARELYALDPGEFTAARNAAARQAKATDAVRAGEVAALRKPSPAAWLVNLLARHRADALDAVLRLGERMRVAQEQLDRAELGRLGAERRAAVAALAREGASLAAERGRPPTASVLGELEQTLQAATTDASAAAAVRSGLLMRALRATGFEPVDLDGAVAAPGASALAPTRGSAPAAGPPTPVQLADVRRLKEARQEADRLEREADTAVADLDALDRRNHRLQVRRTSLEAEIAELREQLGVAESALTAVAEDASALADAHGRALREVEESASRARAARAIAGAIETPR